MENVDEETISPQGSGEVTHPNVFIKPVPPNWDEEKLRQFFSAFGEVDSVRVSPASRPGVQSHAFVRFEATEAAAAALEALQNALIGGVPVAVKSADSDMAPRLQSGQEASPWCYCRGLPATLSRDEVVAMFTVYGPIKDIKHFPSTENYRGSGALVQFEATDQAAAAIQALNGTVLPTANQPLLVRFADSPTEKAAKAARKERVWQRGPSMPPPHGIQSLQEQLHAQLILQSLEAAGSAFAPAAAGPGFLGAGTPGMGTPLDMSRSASLQDPAWLNAAGLANAHSMPAGGGGMKPANGGGGGSSIYIKGLPESADKLWLYERFSRFGGILSVRVLVDEKSGKCNGIGFVNFTTGEAARAAHETMNGVNMGERLLHVMVQNNASMRPSRANSLVPNGLQAHRSGRLPDDVIPQAW